jgi:hypothetical protein
MSRSFSNRRKIERKRVGKDFNPGDCPQCGARLVFYDMGIFDYTRAYMVFQCPRFHSTTAFIGRYDSDMRFYADEVSK